MINSMECITSSSGMQSLQIIKSAEKKYVEYKFGIFQNSCPYSLEKSNYLKNYYK